MTTAAPSGSSDVAPAGFAGRLDGVRRTPSRQYSRGVRSLGAVLLFLGVAALLVAGVSLVFPQLRESAEDTAKKLEEAAESGRPPKVEVLGGDAKTIPWALLAAGTGLVVAGIRLRRVA